MHKICFSYDQEHIKSENKGFVSEVGDFIFMYVFHYWYNAACATSRRQSRN